MISIILCTYNRAHTLKETIDSILRQTYRAFELIVVDDGSTDNTLELLGEYKDERIRIFPQKENQYYCIAVNYGIRQMRGDYLAFATSDDIWETQKLEIQIEELSHKSNCGACFTFSDIIDEESQKADEEFEMLSGLLVKNYKTQREWVQHFIFEGNCLCHPSALIRKEVIDEVGGFNLMYCQSGDMELWLRIVRKYPICIIEKTLVHYRCYKNPLEQVSGADEMKAARFFNEHMMIRRNFLRELTAKELVEFFGNCFRKPDAHTPLELEIERAFLLMDCTHHLPGLRILGIEKLEELLRIPEALEVLKNSYGVDIHDIYEWNREHFYMDFGVHVRLAEQEKELKELRENLTEQKLRLTVTEKNLQKKEQDLKEMEDLLNKAVLEKLKIEEGLSKKYRGKRR